MGEITEMILDGTLCELCGVFMGDINDDDFEAPGFTQTCKACQEEIP